MFQKLEKRKLKRIGRCSCCYAEIPTEQPVVCFDNAKHGGGLIVLCDDCIKQINQVSTYNMKTTFRIIDFMNTSKDGLAISDAAVERALRWREYPIPVISDSNLSHLFDDNFAYVSDIRTSGSDLLFDVMTEKKLELFGCTIQPKIITHSSHKMGDVRVVDVLEFDYFTLSTEKVWSVVNE